jgi:hypothetical protein
MEVIIRSLNKYVGHVRYYKTYTNKEEKNQITKEKQKVTPVTS